jgi:hypothetical protein
MNKSLLALTSAIILTQTVAAMDNYIGTDEQQRAEYEYYARMHAQRQNPQPTQDIDLSNDEVIARLMQEQLVLENNAPEVTDEDRQYMQQLQLQFGGEELIVPQVTDEDRLYMQGLQNQFGGNAYFGNNHNFGEYQPQNNVIFMGGNGNNSIIGNVVGIQNVQLNNVGGNVQLQQVQHLQGGIQLHNNINNAPRQEQVEQEPDLKTMLADDIMNRFVKQMGDNGINEDDVDLNDQQTMRLAVSTLISEMKFQHGQELTPQEAEALINEFRKQYQ